jgi:hypothetical protein
MPGWSVPNDANQAPIADTPSSRVIRARLDTVGDVKAQLSRLYREARGGKIDPQTATRLASILALLAKLIEGSSLEDRIAALEAKQ